MINLLLEATSVEIGRKIAKLRQEKNLTQKELAEKARISVSYLKKIEEGHGFPNPKETYSAFNLHFKVFCTYPIINIVDLG